MSQKEKFPKISQESVKNLTNIMRKELGLEMPESSYVSVKQAQNLVVTITKIGNSVIMDFNKPIEYFDMTGNDAIDLGRKLIKKGRKAINLKYITPHTAGKVE